MGANRRERERASDGQARRRDPLLAAVCHDLRAPLAAVTMGAQYVLQTTPEDEDSGRSRRVLEAILRSCRQMERLVRDFADLSEIEGDAIDLRLGVHDAAQLLALAAERVRADAAARGVDVEVTLPAAGGTSLLLRCDSERLLRALGHVLDNAIRFAPQGTRVSLAVATETTDVHFRVDDQGPGLTRETQDNLYDRTWHASRADRVGAGLGLAIVRGIVTAHRGRVELATQPGATSFVLVIPREPAG